MDEKIKGEDAIREMYRTSSVASNEGLSYTVVRPGGLTEDPPLGVGSIELNQGDFKTGRISRYDVASVCIEATFYPQYTSGVTLECFYSDTGKTLNTVGMSNILKQKTDPNTYLTGNERRGESWDQLFSGLQKDYKA